MIHSLERALVAEKLRIIRDSYPCCHAPPLISRKACGGSRAFSPCYDAPELLLLRRPVSAVLPGGRPVAPSGTPTPRARAHRRSQIMPSSRLATLSKT